MDLYTQRKTRAREWVALSENEQLLAYSHTPRVLYYTHDLREQRTKRDTKVCMAGLVLYAARVMAHV